MLISSAGCGSERQRVNMEGGEGRAGEGVDARGPEMRDCCRGVGLRVPPPPLQGRDPSRRRGARPASSTDLGCHRSC